MRENNTPLPGKFTSLHTSAGYTQHDGGLSNANWIRSNPRSPSYSPICFLGGMELLVLLGSPAGLDTAGLAGRGVLLGLLRAADGADTGNGLLTNVGTVTVPGGLGGNTLVDPVSDQYRLYEDEMP